jgi:hypothetical protein
LLLATVSLLVAVCLALSLNRASEVEPGLYLAGSRLLLPLPFAIWFLAFGVLDTAKSDLRQQSRNMNTLIPAYDRRGWLTQTSRQQPVKRIIVAVPTCGSVAPAAGQCTVESAGVVLVRTSPVPAARALDQITGMHVMSGMFIFF